VTVSGIPPPARPEDLPRLRAQGVPVLVKDEDVARLSPLGHAHINFLGRYAITASAPAQGLRQLGQVPELPGTAS
jgi:hypothetical protein